MSVDISGFTFIHNGIAGGYPFYEAIMALYGMVHEMVVVDMASTDGTREVLKRMRIPIRILDGAWEPGQAGECLKRAHSKYRECQGDVIWHFEADEVFSPRLVEDVHWAVGNGNHDVTVWRLQVEQNFQRCRWYPELVHRVFPNDGTTIKHGHTTDVHIYHIRDLYTMSIKSGYLWDCTNCFRDDYKCRIAQQAELWGGGPNLLRVAYHAGHPNKVSPSELEEELKLAHWEWNASPFELPPSLQMLLGQTSYRRHLQCRQLIS